MSTNWFEELGGKIIRDTAIKLLNKMLDDLSINIDGQINYNFNTPEQILSSRFKLEIKNIETGEILASRDIIPEVNIKLPQGEIPIKSITELRKKNGRI